MTYANCSVQRFNDCGVWPVSIGHPCIGCTEPSVLFKMPVAAKVPVQEPTPFAGFAPADPGSKGRGPDPLATGFAGALVGAGVGAAAMLSRKLPDHCEPEEPESDESK